MIKNIAKDRVVIWIILALLICSTGGIYDFNMAFYGVIISLVLVFVVKRRGQMEVEKNTSTLAMLLILAGYIISALMAADKGIAFLGIIRIAVLCLCFLLWNNLGKESREKIWKGMTDAISMITLLSMIGYFIPYSREILFHAGRFGGVLQYSNTYACLLLLTLIVLIFQRQGKWTVVAYIQAAVLCMGIIWCGSRSVFVLFVLSLIALLIYFFKKIRWKMFGIIAAIVVSGLIVSLFVSGLNVSHLFQLTLSSSTLNGRILYWRDAGEQLLRRPQGLGYMGYYFLQPQFQTGNYVTKYVHNDILQFGLDGGWLAMAGILLLFARNIFCKNNSVRNRFVLVVLFLHVLFDFNLQYGFLFCVLLMCTSTGNGKKLVIKALPGYAVSLAGLAVSAYFSIALGCSFYGNQDVALAMYPANTFALETQMIDEDDTDAADQIIKQNGMLASAYEYHTMELIQNGDYEAADASVENMLKCAGFQSDYYDLAVYEWSYCLKQLVEDNDLVQAQKFLDKIQGMPQRIADKEKQATVFAFRINDKPKIELSEQVTEYIEKLQQVNLED